MYATISADIVSSTSLCIEETIALKQRIEDLFSVLEKRFPGFWGRLIKGDYGQANKGRLHRVSVAFS